MNCGRKKRFFSTRENQKSAGNTFPRLGKRENEKNRLSQTWEERKTEENGRPNIGKTEKQRKMTFPTLGKSKNSEKWLSQTWENQKMPQAAFSTPWKAKKRRKSFVARERNVEIAKNSVSLASDERKTRKIVLRGIPKGRNSEKQGFGMPRRVVFCENEPSGSPEASKF